MSFGSDLQGWQSHEALLRLQDYEISLLENIRKCIAQRAKCDREFVSALSAVTNGVTHKIGDGGYETPTGQIWTTIINETEALMEIMRSYADQLGSNILEAVTQLMAEKKLVRKMYAEKRNSMDMELDRLIDEVNKCKELYERRLTKLVVNRFKYENMFRKVRTGSNSKLDEVRAKYLRSEAKVRSTHNQYILALCEANVYQQQYSCIMLPTLLDVQQGLQEDLVHLCKSILEQYADLTDWSKTQFQELHSNIRTAIASVNATSEYSEFVASHRTEPVKFSKQEFQQKIVQNYLPNSPLASGSILVDETTIETIRQSKASFLEQLAKCRQRLSSKQMELTEAERAISSNHLPPDSLDLSIHMNKRMLSSLKWNLIELQCNEEKYTELSQLLGEPLTRLGSNRPPRGFSELNDFGSQLDADNFQQTSQPSTPNNLQNTISYLRSSITKKMQFRRSRSSTSGGPETAATFRGSVATADDTDHYVTVERQNNVPSAQTNIDSNTVHTIASHYADRGSPQLSGSSRYVEVNVLRATVMPVEAAGGGGNNARSGQTTVPVNVTMSPIAESVAAETNSTDNSEDGYLPVTRTSPAVRQQESTADQNVSLDSEIWFHGVLPRDDVQHLLLNDGDFLVRASKSKRTGEVHYVLSVKWMVHKHFIIQESPQGGFRLERGSYVSVQQLVNHLMQSAEPITIKSGAILKSPVVRPDWALSNDDIELQLKIGSGQFGEVFRATLKSSGVTVAVKTCHEELGDEMKSKFLQEGRILKQYDHPNIVRFIGIAAQRHPVMIVMEFVPGGSLLSFLRKHGSNQTIKTLVKMCEDAAAGMAYLSNQNCLHRDLAARNCLVGENLVVKISDFGMSRQEREYVIGCGRRQIPIKWTAPEALAYGTYTTECDVWSFGVLVWEVFSFGSTPYPGLTNAQASDKVVEGYRMPPPSSMPDAVYGLMMRCWEQEPQSRPSFVDVHRELGQLRNTVR